jgi:hypothetical protein
MLQPEELEVLDRALRRAYGHLIDKAILQSHQVYRIRDVMVLAMVRGICKGEKDISRVARRGIFAACATLAPEWASAPGSRSTAA